MGKVIVIQFVTLDGVTQDPDGSEDSSTAAGRSSLDRRPWRATSSSSAHCDEFSRKMNAIRKLVASHSLKRVDGWSNSTLLGDDLIDEVRRRKDSASSNPAQHALSGSGARSRPMPTRLRSPLRSTDKKA